MPALRSECDWFQMYLALCKGLELVACAGRMLLGSRIVADSIFSGIVSHPIKAEEFVDKVHKHVEWVRYRRLEEVTERKLSAAPRSEV